jgi:hypothetical protein
MVAGALQTSGGFESDDRGFENWMADSSAGVEREIAAEKANRMLRQSQCCLPKKSLRPIFGVKSTGFFRMPFQ